MCVLVRDSVLCLPPHNILTLLWVFKFGHYSLAKLVLRLDRRGTHAEHLTPTFDFILDIIINAQFVWHAIPFLSPPSIYHGGQEVGDTMLD